MATSIAWLAVSSVITSVTASASGPPIARTSSVADGRIGVDRHQLVTSTTAAKTPYTSARSSTTVVSTSRPRFVQKPPTVRIVPPTNEASTGTSVATISPTTTAPPPPETTTTTTPPSQTFASNGGVITVSCQGSAIQLVSATPNNGYSMQVDSSGPQEARVEFSSSHHDSNIDATCQSGKPVANVYEDS